MQALINPVNQLVVVTAQAIEINSELDCFETPTHRIYDPRPSHGVTVTELDLPESHCDYQIVDGVPVRITPVPPPTREQLKAEREAAVAAITVTTAAGNTFDGDEVSQTRMARAIIALSTGLAPSVTWVLSDNSTIDATATELTEALVLAGMAQAAIWVIA